MVVRMRSRHTDEFREKVRGYAKDNPAYVRSAEGSALAPEVRKLAVRAARRNLMAEYDSLFHRIRHRHSQP